MKIYNNNNNKVPGVLLGNFHVLVVTRLLFPKDVLGVWCPNEKEENCPHEAYHCQSNEHRPAVVL